MKEPFYHRFVDFVFHVVFAAFYIFGAGTAEPRPAALLRAPAAAVALGAAFVTIVNLSLFWFVSLRRGCVALEKMLF